MFATVVDGLDPGGEQVVQLHQVVELAAGADLDQKLLPNGAEYPLDLAATFRLSGREWISRIPSDAQARSSCLLRNADPLST